LGRSKKIDTLGVIKNPKIPRRDRFISLSSGEYNYKRETEIEGKGTITKII
jgi:hypothetical protein